MLLLCTSIFNIGNWLIHPFWKATRQLRKIVHDVTHTHISFFSTESGVFSMNFKTSRQGRLPVRNFELTEHALDLQRTNSALSRNLKFILTAVQKLVCTLCDEENTLRKLSSARNLSLNYFSLVRHSTSNEYKNHPFSKKDRLDGPRKAQKIKFPQ